MCIADLHDYPPSMREEVAHADGTFLASLSREIPPPPVERDGEAIPLHPNIVIRTHHGVPRVPSDDDRLGIWAARYFGNGYHRATRRSFSLFTRIRHEH